MLMEECDFKRNSFIVFTAATWNRVNKVGRVSSIIVRLKRLDTTSPSKLSKEFVGTQIFGREKPLYNFEFNQFFYTLLLSSIEYVIEYDSVSQEGKVSFICRKRQFFRLFSVERSEMHYDIIEMRCFIMVIFRYNDCKTQFRHKCADHFICIFILEKKYKLFKFIDSILKLLRLIILYSNSGKLFSYAI